jgi:prepilin-type processing-associated H-X9-DG protein/prepilin-type N-terminal cleavage/methylation domain-containing protein
MPLRQNKFRGAFTLVELLVVIGIVAVLIGLLLPALAVARANSRAIACLSNLRQMAVAAQAYCNENGGRFPVAYWTAANDPIYTGFNWDFTVVRDVGASTTSVRPGLLWQGPGDAPGLAVQQCPAYEPPTGADGGDPYTGYNYNTSGIGHGQFESVPAPVKAGQVRRASEVALFGDGEYYGGPNKFMRSPFPTAGDASFAGRSAGTQGYRHRGRTNVAFVDGHGEMVGERHTNTTPKQIPRVGPRTGFLSEDNRAYE